MATVKVTHSYTVMSKDKFLIARYDSDARVMLPDGKMTSTITCKGYNLPEDKGITFEFSGDFIPYTKGSKTTFTFNVESVKELIPTEEDAIIAYLSSLKGVGKVLAKRLFETFGASTFSIIESNPPALQKIKGISKGKAEKIQAAYTARQSARQLFDYLYKFGISDKQIMKLHTYYGENALSIIQQNPYSILEVPQIGFKTADYIAKKTGLTSDNPDRIRAGIVEVLTQAELGGELFNSSSKYPDFMLNQYLREPIFNLMYEPSTLSTGGTYLPRNILYLMLLKLLKVPVTESKFDDLLYELHLSKKVFLTIDHDKPKDDLDQVKVYRYYTATVEYRAAKTLRSLCRVKLPECDGLLKTVTEKEKLEMILLSSEQREAVIKAITSPVSIITGGPGTGKTSILKVILAVYKHYFPGEGVLLMAPSGKASKRMSEQTGYPAKTIHKALNVYADEDGKMVETNDKMFTEKLIIVDETSMMGNIIFESLLSHINPGTRLVFVGDIDQLPSIEVGSVLRELINSGSVPTTKLTKTFRQASGSTIITNASRIKIGVDSLDYDDDFQFIPCDSSEAIAEKAAELVPRLIKEYGENNVMCLTAYRRNTESGSNALNASLKKIIHPSAEGDRYFENKGMRIYEGDKVMFTHNTEALTNGDIGYVTRISKTKDSLMVTCEFDGISIPFEDEETNALELAYAMTIHKSQGSEASCVLLVSDMAHKIMLRRNLIYTGVTRAKNKLLILGQKEAVSSSIKTQDSVYRRSQLGKLLQA